MYFSMLSILFISLTLLSCSKSYESQNTLKGNSPFISSAKDSQLGWREWNVETLNDAKEYDKLIFLLMAPSFCDHCKFFDQFLSQKEVTDLINKKFIPIRLNQDLRPDLFVNYLDVAQFFNLRLAEPVAVVLTPDLFPHRFLDIMAPKKVHNSLKSLSDSWIEKPKEFRSARDSLLKKIATTNSVESAEKSDYLIEDFLEDARSRYDPVYAGFSKNTKYPHPVQIELLLRVYQRAKFKTDKKQIAHMIMHTLTAMYFGSFYDHVDGGFFLNANKANWERPRLRKSVELNLQMMITYLKVYRYFGNELFKVVALDIKKYLNKHLEKGFITTHSLVSSKFLFSKKKVSNPVYKGFDQYNDDQFLPSLNSFMTDKMKLEKAALSLKPLADVRRATEVKRNYSLVTPAVNSLYGIALIELYRSTQDLAYISDAKELYRKVLSLHNFKLLPDYVFTMKLASELFRLTEDKFFLQSFERLLKQTEKYWSKKHRTYLYSYKKDLFKPVYKLSDGLYPNSNFVLADMLRWYDQVQSKAQSNARLLELWKGGIKSVSRAPFFHPSALLFLDQWVHQPRLIRFRGDRKGKDYRLLANYFARYDTPDYLFLSETNSIKSTSIKICDGPNCELKQANIVELIKSLKSRHYSWDIQN